MIYSLEPHQLDPVTLTKILKDNPQILFVSLIAVDLGNNHTDEKIPVSEFLNNLQGYLQKGIQTDGSSVALPKIADINDAKVDIIPDPEVRWFVDYAPAHLTAEDLPVGTLLIPCFLYHKGERVGSRSVLKRATQILSRELCQLIEGNIALKRELNIPGKVKHVELTLATELEFWVHSPYVSKDEEGLFVSQRLKEQYWKRPFGSLRNALEETLILLERYGFSPEMGHKEVGGVGSKLQGSNVFTHMEQVEIDWKYADAMQAIDHEMIAKDIIFDVFARHGLDVTFKAKPIEGVAGSGEHHHISLSVVDDQGKRHNLFAPSDLSKHYLNTLGYGAMMGILRHYKLINPFVTNTNDAFNRLKPGFEAPVSTVCCLGHTEKEPSRNRTVLIGLIRDMDNPLATRFELRSPYAGSNSYLLSAAVVACMLDGMRYAVNKPQEMLLAEISKQAGEEADYLLAAYQYRSEVDVFTSMNAETREVCFGPAPKTVFEVIQQFNEDEASVLTRDGIFNDRLIDSYLTYIRRHWLRELSGRVIPEYIQTLRSFKILHLNEPSSQMDEVRWDEIYQEIIHLMKDTHRQKSLISEITEASDQKDHETVSRLQFELATHVTDLKRMYANYKKNIIHLTQTDIH